MELSPELQAQVDSLDKHLKHTDTIKCLENDFRDLQEGQNEIMAKFERHEDENRMQFEKGAKRMGEIEGKMDNLKDLIMQSNIDRDRQHTDLKNEIRDDKLRELSNKLEKAEGHNAKTDGRIWEIVKIVIGVFIVAGLGWVGISAK